MQEHLHRFRISLDRGLIHRVFEAAFLHRLQKDRGFVAAGVGEDRLAARCEQPGGEVREGRSVTPLVEHVGGEDEVEGAEA
jgi:hypothetical protein